MNVPNGTTLWSTIGDSKKKIINEPLSRWDDRFFASRRPCWTRAKRVNYILYPCLQKSLMNIEEKHRCGNSENVFGECLKKFNSWEGMTSRLSFVWIRVRQRKQIKCTSYSLVADEISAIVVLLPSRFWMSGTIKSGEFSITPPQSRSCFVTLTPLSRSRFLKFTPWGRSRFLSTRPPDLPVKSNRALMENRMNIHMVVTPGNSMSAREAIPIRKSRHPSQTIGTTIRREWLKNRMWRTERLLGISLIP
jgi:hypothetical protein